MVIAFVINDNLTLFGTYTCVYCYMSQKDVVYALLRVDEDKTFD